jgi:hypothetical protein
MEGSWKVFLYATDTLCAAYPAARTRDRRIAENGRQFALETHGFRSFLIVPAESAVIAGCQNVESAIAQVVLRATTRVFSSQGGFSSKATAERKTNKSPAACGFS